MHSAILAALFPIPVAVAMCSAGIAVFLIGLWSAKDDITKARGLDKIAALSRLCFAIPLAVFGALHLSDAQSLMALVPRYMPWRMFWAYFVGFALIAASLSVATKIQVRWSGLLFGIMMLLFVAMLYLPGAIRNGSRITWTIVFRESSFGGAGWVLTGIAIGSINWRGKSLITVGRVLIAMTAIFFGIQHFLHPLGLPAVPLQKEMPTWVPARAFIDYLTGAFLIIASVCFLLAWKTRMAATNLGAWILFLVVAIYVPVM